jgi:hypothetical protein
MLVAQTCRYVVGHLAAHTSSVASCAAPTVSDDHADSTRSARQRPNAKASMVGMRGQSLPQEDGRMSADVEPSPGDVLHVAARYDSTRATVILDGEFDAAGLGAGHFAFRWRLRY